VEGSLARFLALLLCAGAAPAEIRYTLLYTEAPRYRAGAPDARFPAGAALELVSNGQRRALVPGFAASADASVSFDGQRALFAGKRKPGDAWQIWEVALDGRTAPRRITAGPEDAMAPFYMAGGRVVYALRTSSGWQLETAPIEGGERLRLTYTPGNHLATDALRDGRVLFDGPYPGLPSAVRDVYAVYADGSGVEAYRCDHGSDRHSGRELASGDIVFESAGRLARFTSASAVQMEIPTPAGERPGGEFAGPVAELADGEWLAAYRPNPKAPFGIYLWKPGLGQPEKVVAAEGANALQPVLVRAREVPKRHPSGLGNREGANLLCLNVYTARSPIPADSVAGVRVWALDDNGSAVDLGQAPVARDGSFFVQTPSERGVRFELLDRAGKTVAAEKGWFWARRGEQRVCVGCHAGPERAPDNAVPEILLRSTNPARMVLPAYLPAGAEVTAK
jgi:hypothetical protein